MAKRILSDYETASFYDGSRSNRGNNRICFRNPRGRKRFYTFSGLRGGAATSQYVYYYWSEDGKYFPAANKVSVDNSTGSGTNWVGFDVKIHDTGSSLDVFLIIYYENDGDTDTSDTITWSTRDPIDTAISKLLTLTHSVAIARTDNGRLVVAFTEDKTVHGKDYRVIKTITGSSDGAAPTWANETDLYDPAGDANQQDKDDCAVGIEAFDSTYGDRVCIYARTARGTGTAPADYGVDVWVYTWNGSSFTQEATDTPITASSVTGVSVSVAIGSDDKVNLLAKNNTSDLIHYKYPTAGALGTETTYTVHDTFSTVAFATLSIDRTTNDLYAFWVRDDTFGYKKTDDTTISWSAQYDIPIGFTDLLYVSSSQRDYGGAIQLAYWGGNTNMYFTEFKHTQAIQDPNSGSSRQVFRNSRSASNNRSYKFFVDIDGSLKYQWYNDSVWSSSIDVFTAGDVTAFDVKVHDTGTLLDVYVVLIDYTNADLTYIKGTIADASNTISWNTAQDIDAALATNELEYMGCAIARTDNARLVVAWVEYDTVDTRFELRLIGGSNDGTAPTWSNETTPITVHNATSWFKSAFVGLESFSSTYPNRVVVYSFKDGGTEGTSVYTYDWNGSSMSQQATGGFNDPITSLSASIASDDRVHMVFTYLNLVRHRKYPTAGGLGSASEVSVFSGTAPEFGETSSLTIDHTNDEVYVFYKKQSETTNFYYKKSDVATISFGTEQTITIAVDIDYISTSQREQDSKMLIVSSPEISEGTDVNYHEIDLVTETEADFDRDASYEVELRQNFDRNAIYEVELRQNFSRNAVYEAELRQNFDRDASYPIELQDAFSRDSSYEAELRQNFDRNSSFEVELRQNFSRDATYSRKIADDFDRDSSYSVELRQNMDRDASFEVELRQNMDRDASFEVELRQNMDRSASYETELRQNFDRNASYPIELQDPFSRDSSFEVELRQNFDRSASYETELRQNFSRNAVYEAELRQNFDRDASYETELRQNFDRDASYAVDVGETEADFDRDASYEVEVRQNFDRDASYSVELRQNFSRDATYEAELRQNFDRDASYPIELQDAFSRDSSFEVELRQNFSRNAVYEAELRQNMDRDASYPIELQDPFSRDSSFEVELRQDFSRDASYEVSVGETEADFDRDAFYSVELRQDFDRSASYEAELRQNMDRDASYSTELRQNFSRSSLYEVEVWANLDRNVVYEAELRQNFDRSASYPIELQDPISRDSIYEVEVRTNLFRSVTYTVDWGVKRFVTVVLEANLTVTINLEANTTVSVPLEANTIVTVPLEIV
jgi:hypothetical protein